MADGCYRQFDPAFDLFLFRLVIDKSIFYDGDSESTRGEDPAGR
jgi:hypothetical protein